MKTDDKLIELLTQILKVEAIQAASNKSVTEGAVVSRLMWKIEWRSSGMEPRRGDTTVWPRRRSSLLEALSDRVSRSPAARHCSTAR